MAARFHSNSIDRLALNREGYGVMACRKGEVVAIFRNNDEGSAVTRGHPEFERVLTKCMVIRAEHSNNIDNSGMSEG